MMNQISDLTSELAQQEVRIRLDLMLYPFDFESSLTKTMT